MAQKTTIGIDVSKNTLDICISNSKDVAFMKVPNSIVGVEKIKDKVSDLKLPRTTKLVVESTGDYHILVSQLLQDLLEVYVINPLITKQYLKANVRKIKSDKADSKLLAEIGKDTNNLHQYKSNVSQVYKKKTLSLIASIEKHKSALKLSIKNLKETYTKLGVNEPILDDINTKIKELELIQRKLQEKLKKQVSGTKLLSSIEQVKGISLSSGVQIITLIEDKEFKSKGSLIAYAGLDVSTRQSGKWLGKVRITKRGNPLLRRHLIRASWGLLMHNEVFQEYAKYYKDKGRKYYEILVIIARKLLKMIYGAIKSGNGFDINKFSFTY